MRKFKIALAVSVFLNIILGYVVGYGGYVAMNDSDRLQSELARCKWDSYDPEKVFRGVK